MIPLKEEDRRDSYEQLTNFVWFKAEEFVHMEIDPFDVGQRKPKQVWMFNNRLTNLVAWRMNE